MPLFKIPVTWTLGAFVEVEADDFESALEKDIDIPDDRDGEYQDDSFIINYDYAEELEQQRLDEIGYVLPEFKIGDLVSAKYDGDGECYDAIILNRGPNGKHYKVRSVLGKDEEWYCKTRNIITKTFDVGL